jgi:hypothetical protein
MIIPNKNEFGKLGLGLNVVGIPAVTRKETEKLR